MFKRRKRHWLKKREALSEIAKAEDKHFEGVIDSETFINSKKRYTNKINKLQDELLKIKHFNRAFEF